jgi:hypothetical protein
MQGAVRKAAAKAIMEDSKPLNDDLLPSSYMLTSLAFINHSQGMAKRTEILSMFERGYEA